MMIKSSFRNPVWLLPLCLLLVLMGSCESKDKYAGVYKAEAKETPKQAEITVELKANGDGLWRVGDEEVAFSWDIKGGELRVNTKGGGVIIGKIKKDTLQMTLPNMKTLTFKKMR
jgi:hypothetical protein